MLRHQAVLNHSAFASYLIFFWLYKVSAFASLWILACTTFPLILEATPNAAELIFQLRKSLTQFGHQMRSGDLLAYLYLNGHFNGSSKFLVLFCSYSTRKSFSEIELVCDRWTDGRTNGRTDGRTDRHPLIEMRRYRG